VSDSLSDRRAHPRIDAAIDLHVESGDSGGTVARMVTGNLSMGGLYCTSQMDFPEMTRIAIRLMLPDGAETPEPVDIHAVVVRRRELAASRGNGDPRYELALYFTRIADDGRDRLAAYLETLD